MDGANAASADSRSKASSLGLRIASGVILIPLLVLAAWWEISSALLVGLVTVLALIELYGIFRQGGLQPRVGLGIMVGLLLCLAAAIDRYTPFEVYGAVISLSIMLALVYEIRPQDRTNSLTSWAITFAGAYYIGGLLSSFILIRQLDAPLQTGWLQALRIPPGTAWIIFTLAITFLNDTFAYFVGRAFGRTKMAPILSPKKSWEGAAGGLVASTLSALLCVPLLGLPIHPAYAALIGALAGVVGPAGDLAESLIKRQIGIKDSGTLIPGHGGMLDRVDSLLFVAPMVYYMVLLTIAR
jgi:phosphatidate cytidylyltransferase